MSLNNMNQLIIVTEMLCAVCDVQTEFLNAGKSSIMGLRVSEPLADWKCSA
jgi:hypothetical protein